MRSAQSGLPQGHTSSSSSKQLACLPGDGTSAKSFNEWELSRLCLRVCTCMLSAHPVAYCAHRLPGTPEFALTPATVRRNDTSALSINEWTGEREC